MQLGLQKPVPHALFAPSGGKLRGAQRWQRLRKSAASWIPIRFLALTMATFLLKLTTGFLECVESRAVVVGCSLTALSCKALYTVDHPETSFGPEEL